MVTGLAGPGSVAGGVWEVVANQSTALRDAGYDVSIVAGWLGGDPPRQVRDLPVTLVPVRPLVQRLGLRAVTGPGWPAAVQRAVAGADVAHVHLCRDYLTTRATRTIAAGGTPIVAQPHGMLRPPSSAGLALFDRLVTAPALRRVERFVTLTDQEKPDLAGLGVPADRLHTIENATAQPAVRWRPPGPQEPLVLLFASRLHPRKQVLVFAETVERLHRRDPRVRGVVAGPDQGDLAGLRDFIARGDRSSFLTYAGELDREHLLEQLAAATAFVLPARAEPFGLVLVEALSVGTPVVSTSETPLAAALTAAGAAVVSPPDVEHLTAALQRVLHDPALRDQLSRNGRALHRSRWTNAAMVANLLDLYRTAVDVAGHTASGPAGRTAVDVAGHTAAEPAPQTAVDVAGHTAADSGGRTR